MANSTSTGTLPHGVVATAPAEDSALPGMKRGIAIGIACSVGIIMVALLAFFAYRRRKQQAAKHTKLSPEEPVEMDAGAFWPQEKARHVQATPYEADARTIHELDGSELPELPGHYEGQELNANRKTPRASYHAGDDNAYEQKLKQWNHWSIALDADYSRSTQEAPNHNSYLETPPSRLHATIPSPSGEPMPYTPSQNTSFSCVSPLAPSPLEDAHTHSSRASQIHQQYRYDPVRTSK